MAILASFPCRLLPVPQAPRGVAAQTICPPPQSLSLFSLVPSISPSLSFTPPVQFVFLSIFTLFLMIIETS